MNNGEIVVRVEFCLLPTLVAADFTGESVRRVGRIREMEMFNAECFVFKNDNVL